MACNLKINIWKCAIGSFFEWDKLDQAAGGKEQAIGACARKTIVDILILQFPGTKLHQHTCKAIAKRKPALMSALQKFNKYCKKLETLHKPEWNLPIPQLLPTTLSALRDASTLMEDVWITRQPGTIPRWLDSLEVREGIRAMLKMDRCLEERCRLGLEANNLYCWFGQELAAIEYAVVSPSSEFTL